MRPRRPYAAVQRRLRADPTRSSRVDREGAVVLDKRLAVRGRLDPEGRTREPSPFAAMALAWELAAATLDNPVGIREGPGAWPHIVDPRQRDRERHHRNR